MDFYESFHNKKIIRSHDSFIKTEYLKEISKRGYTHESNFLIRQSHDLALRLAPFQAWGQETIRVPITWEDDEWFYGERDVNTIKEELSNQLKVFNFHPIHVYINTSCVENDNAIKHKQHDPGFSSMINSIVLVLKMRLSNLSMQNKCELCCGDLLTLVNIPM